MTEALMIGTRGWEHAAWAGGFYPGELPDDWRFCFYSNNLRSVLVPQAVWLSATRADVAQWSEDSDPAFRFVLELPAPLGMPCTQAQRDSVLAVFTEVVEPIAVRTAGLVLRIEPSTPLFPDWFEHLLHRLADLAPVCVDLPDGEWRGADPLAALDRQGAGLAWHCAQEEQPRPGGRMLAALAPAADARTVRQWIEKLARWQAGTPDARAGLFFEASDRSAKLAQEGRLIAELMGV
jgi:hypothetical protein